MALADYAGARYDVRFTRGDDIVETFTFADSDGEPIDLDGYTFQSQVRRTDGTLLASFTIVRDGNAVTRRLSRSVTAGISEPHVHDLQWSDPSGNVRTWVSGRLLPVEQVTQ